MSSQLAFALLLDSTLAEVFQSPFIVPCFGTVMILGIVVAGIWSGVRTREMQSQERLAAIAKGLPPEPAWNQPPIQTGIANPATGDLLSRSNNVLRARRTGIMLIAIGIGVAAFFLAITAIVRERGVLVPAAAGLIPCAIGIGFLVDARVRATELSNLLQTTPSSQPIPQPTTSPELRPLH